MILSIDTQDSQQLETLTWDLLEPDIDHFFEDMAQRNRVPTKPLRTTWRRGLLAPLGTVLPSAWLRNLYQLSMEGSNVPVYATAAKVISSENISR